MEKGTEIVEVSREEFLGIKDTTKEITKGLEIVEITENEKDICKKCGHKLYANECKTVGYCEICAVFHEDVRKIWEEKGLAKFCKNCGHILFEKKSLSTGICCVCRDEEKIKNKKENRLDDIDGDEDNDE